MAIANSDGSIILSTKVDTAGLSKGMTSMTGIVSKLGGAMAATFSVKMIANFAKESKNLYKIQMQNEVKLATVMRQRMNATDEQIQKVMDLAIAEQGLGIIGDEVQLAGLQQLATFAKQQETIESLLPAMNNLIAQQYGFEASTESARNVANLMGKVLQGQTGALTRVGITFTEAQEKVLKYGTESEKAATLAEVITDNVGEMNKSLAKTDVGRQQQLANTMGDIKERFGEAANQISIVFLPLLQSVAYVLGEIAKMARMAASNIANSFGVENNQKQWEKIADDTDETTENIEDQTDAQKDLNKEMKKTLAGFDDIQILSSQTADDAMGVEGLDSELQRAGRNLNGSALDGSIYVDEVDKTLSVIMGIIALSLAAIGVILLFTGNIPWGVGFIIAGASALFVTMASASEFGYDGIIQMLTTIMGVAGGALLAIGIILLYFKVAIPTAIGMIVAGGFLIVSSIASQGTFNPDDIASWLSIIMGIAGGALLAIGIFLCYMKVYPAGIGMIIAGATSIISAVAMSSEDITEKIKGWVAVIMAIAGAALLVLGIILTCTGNLILGIPLIVLGAAALVTPIALNWDAILDWIKGAWDAVVGFWNTYIAPIFTAKFWLDLAKNCGNGLIGGFEAAINGIIGMFEKMINWIVDGINSIGFDVPDWLGGGHFGFNIPRVSFGRVSIPRLAQGAVIPPNREFLAVLGDQKHGTNIEAPLQTIVDAFNIATADKNNFDEKIEVVLQIDSRELGRAVIEQGAIENKRMGTKLVVY